MKVKELKGKHGRPDWNPVVEITFEGTKCLALNIKQAAENGRYMDEGDFIRSAIRDKLNELGIHFLIKPPEEEEGEGP